jgi:phosphoglycolate phosphatase-like HAD superfamily hydrolase
VKLAVFDIDGTLTDTEAVDTERFVSAFRQEFGLRLDELDWGAYPHATDSGITREVFQRTFSREPRLDEIRRLKETVSAGDAVWDIETAAALGLPFIGIGDRAQLTSAGVSHTLKDYKDPASFLEFLEAAAPRRPARQRRVDDSKSQ